MKRRTFLALPAAAAPASAAAPAPIAEPHFSSRLHQFVWRNWEIANSDRMAAALGCPVQAILDIGASLGLPAKPSLTDGQLARLYITVIRKNWHLLPEEQILTLLGWDRARFEYTLKEDDALDIKLGPKPTCEPLRWAQPTPAERAAAAAIRSRVRELFGDALHAPGEAPLDFVRDLASSSAPVRMTGPPTKGEIDLRTGWRLEAPPELSVDAARFRSWMEAATGDRLGSGPGRIRVAIDAGLPPGSFRLASSARDVSVSGHDRLAVLAALDCLRDRIEERGGPCLMPGVVERRIAWTPRYLYSPLALYGDPLLDATQDPFPDGLLEKLARRGIGGVWLQAVLHTLAPAKLFPEFGRGHEARLRNLRALTERAAKFGVRVYLYLNEPRAQPAEFFERRPSMRGSSHRGMYAMCTSAPEVRDWLTGSVSHIVRNAPALGGVFTITMSENHTNCFSHGGAWGAGSPNAGDCPRCTRRNSWDVIAEAIGAMRDGLRRESAAAEFIAWDWGWGDALAERLIPLLPKDVRFLSISEWEAPVSRGGVQTKVGEYSISVVGPGPRAERNWARARKAGLVTMAKTQFNNTWEISAVPYIPVPHLVAEHCDRLARAGIGGVMPSWTCGGWPSPNLAVAKAFYYEPRPSPAEAVAGVARARYGRAAAGEMVEAWRLLSEAFREFPYGVSIYVVPTQHGPANLLRLQPTGHAARMILFPHDQYKAWCGSYPPDAARSQFALLARRWAEGVAAMERAAPHVPPSRRQNAEFDLAIARTCGNHFESTANQIEFYQLRDGRRTPETAARMREIARRELELARAQFPLARRWSALAYEASNHYYYTPLDLVEKALNCLETIRELTPPSPAAAGNRSSPRG